MTETERFIRDVIAELRADVAAGIQPTDLVYEDQVMEVEDALAAYLTEPNNQTGHRLNVAVSLLRDYDNTAACEAWVDEVWRQARDAWARVTGRVPGNFTS